MGVVGGGRRNLGGFRIRSGCGPSLENIWGINSSTEKKTKFGTSFGSDFQTPNLHRSAKNMNMKEKLAYRTESLTRPTTSHAHFLGLRHRTNSKYVWCLLPTRTVRLATSRTPSLETVKERSGSEAEERTCFAITPAWRQPPHD